MDFLGYVGSNTKKDGVYVKFYDIKCVVGFVSSKLDCGRLCSLQSQRIKHYTCSVKFVGSIVKKIKSYREYWFSIKNNNE